MLFQKLVALATISTNHNQAAERQMGQKQTDNREQNIRVNKAPLLALIVSQQALFFKIKLNLKQWTPEQSTIWRK